MNVVIELAGFEARSVLVKAVLNEFLHERDASDDTRSSLDILRQAPDDELLAAVRRVLNSHSAMLPTCRVALSGDAHLRTK
jgi:hypothetical protein